MHVILWFALACASSQQTAAPTTVAVAEPAASEPAAVEPAAEPAAAEPAALERLTLKLDPAHITYDAAAGTATFSPDSDRKADTTTHYVLDLDSLQAAVGGRPSVPVVVTVELGPPVEESYAPDENMPQPDGGFVLVTRTGRVVGPVMRAP